MFYFQIKHIIIKGSGKMENKEESDTLEQIKRDQVSNNTHESVIYLNQEYTTTKTVSTFLFLILES